jgi:hypothetical protein
MIRYIPSSVAAELSDALWALSRPPQVRQPQDTRYLFGCVAALDGTRWLEVEDDYQIPIHPQAELGPIADILQMWIDNGQLHADTITNLAALVKLLRGQRLVIWNAFPQFFKDMSKTHQEMIDAGLLATPTMP